MARYGAAVLLGLLDLVPLVAGLRRLRRRALPAWPTSISAVAVTVTTLAVITLTAEALGTVGQYRRVSMCVVLALIGVGVWTAAGRCPPAEAGIGAQTTHASRGARIAAALAVGLVVASWAVRTIAALRHGMETVDTLWYHMPTAARFVQTGFVSRLHYVDADPVTVFFPATSPLLHGFGIELLGNDALSPLVNLGWLALALVSAWSIGEPYGVAPVTLTGAAVVLSAPGMVTTQPGGAYTDAVGLALLLATVALLLRAARDAPHRFAALALSALAAGLAVGTKFTLLAPVGGLAMVVVLAELIRRNRMKERARALGLWFALVFAAGGFFYVRNVVRVGNPLPSLSFGPLHLPTPPVPTPSFTVAQYLLHASIWRDFYLPGLRDALGPAWWAEIALTIGAGALLFTRRRSYLERLLGIVPLVALIGYLLTPQFLGFAGAPIFFVYNVRYLTPALGVGLCLLPTVPSLMSVQRTRAVHVVLIGMLVATQWGSSIWAWSVPQSPQRVTERIVPVDVLGGIAIGLLTLSIGVALVLARRRVPVALVIATVTVAVVAGYPLQQSYLRHRYQSTPPMPNIYRFAQGETHQRIAVVGTDLQYPLYGSDLSNYVQYVGRQGTHGSFSPVTTCAAWRRALDAGRYGWVVITTPGFPAVRHPAPPREEAWTSSDPHARLVRTDVHPDYGKAVLFRLNGPLDPNTCAAS